MRKVRSVVALAAVIVFAAVAAGAAQGSSASVPKCLYKKGNVVVALAGVGLGTAYCRGFNSTFHGRRFYGQFGRTRCEFYNFKREIMLAVLTRNKLLGYVTCTAVAPALRRRGFREIKKPQI